MPGVLTADPRVAPKACTVPRLSFAEASELAYFGARVLHPKTLHPAVERDIPVRICNSRAPDGRSTVVVGESEMSPQTVKAIAHKTGVTTVQITSARMLGAYGFLRALFEVFVSIERRSMLLPLPRKCVAVARRYHRCRLSLPTRETGTLSIDPRRGILCIVAKACASRREVPREFFSTISDINVSLISQGASRINLTFAVEEARAREAVMRLHKEFFEKSGEELTAIDEWGVSIPA